MVSDAGVSFTFKMETRSRSDRDRQNFRFVYDNAASMPLSTDIRNPAYSFKRTLTPENLGAIEYDLQFLRDGNDFKPQSTSRLLGVGLVNLSKNTRQARDKLYLYASSFRQVAIRSHPNRRLLN